MCCTVCLCCALVKDLAFWVADLLLTTEVGLQVGCVIQIKHTCRGLLDTSEEHDSKEMKVMLHALQLTQAVYCLWSRSKAAKSSFPSNVTSTRASASCRKNMCSDHQHLTDLESS